MIAGSVNEISIRLIKEIASRWDRGAPVYVVGSGDFAIERVLCGLGFVSVYSNDQSLYGCMIGNHLCGNPLSIGIRDGEYQWLEKYMLPGVDSIAAIMLVMQMSQYVGRSEPYHVKMLAAYKNQFDRMFEATRARISSALEGVSLAGFGQRGLFDFASSIPYSSNIIIFPQNYSSSYGRMCDWLNGVFEWDQPEAQRFNLSQLEELSQLITKHENWVIGYNSNILQLETFLRGKTQTGLRSRPYFIYSNDSGPRLALPHQTLQTINIPRLSGDLHGDLSVLVISQAQMNQLRSEYLSPHIIPASSDLNLAVTVGGELIGAMAFSRADFMCDVYMMTDFAVRPSKYKRLSKLVLAAVFSTEVQAILAGCFKRKMETVATTAFTEKAGSMKYRGLFDLYNRSDEKVNYWGHLGRWTLQEGFQWWKKQHGMILND